MLVNHQEGHVQKKNVAEMRIRGWMSWHNRRDMITNKLNYTGQGVHESSKTEMVHASEKEMHGYASKKMQKVDYNNC